jgi:hypothetical protein
VTCENNLGVGGALSPELLSITVPLGALSSAFHGPSSRHERGGRPTRLKHLLAVSGGIGCHSVPFPKPGDVRAAETNAVFWLVIRMAGRRSGSHPREHVVDQDVGRPVVGALHLAPLAQRPVGLVEEPMCPVSF